MIGTDGAGEVRGMQCMSSMNALQCMGEMLRQKSVGEVRNKCENKCRPGVYGYRGIENFVAETVHVWGNTSPHEVTQLIAYQSSRIHGVVGRQY